MDANLRQRQPLSDSVLELFVRPVWHEDAACVGLGSEWFFPNKGDTVHKTASAKAVCAVCPVIEQCREAGLAERWGIWGGTTERDRRKLRRERRRACL